MALDVDPDDLIHPRNYGVAGQPHEAWTQLRKHSPVWLCESTEYEPFYAITRHADIMSISNKPNIFSNSDGPALLNHEQIRSRNREARAPRPESEPKKD